MKRYLTILAGFELWPVAILVAAGFLSNRWLPWAAPVALAFWLLRWIVLGRLFQRTPADLAIALLLLTLPVTLWATALPEKTLPQVHRLLGGIALYFALVGWSKTTQRMHFVQLGVSVAGLALAAVAPLAVEWTAGKLPFIPAAVYERFSLMLADTINANVIAGSLVLFLPIPIAALLFSLRKLAWYEIITALLAAAAMSLVLVLTQARGAWIAFVVSLLVLVLLRWRWGWLLLPLGAGAIAALLHFFSSSYAAYLLTGGLLSSFDGRLEIWSRAIYMVQDFSFTGIGMGSFGDVADALYPFYMVEKGAIPHAHNLPLQVAVDLGVPGLLAWLAVLITVAASAWKAYITGRSQCDPWLAGLGAGLLASQAALVVHGVTDAVVWGMVRPAPFVWALWGLASASIILVQSKLLNREELYATKERKAFTLA